MKTGKSWSITAGAVAILLVAGACRKHVPPPPPPPPPPPAPAAAPLVSLTVEPTTIQRGQSATLRWSAQNASTLDLQPRIGPVATQGSLSVTPPDSITYTITARGAGGSAEATARLTVTAPPSPPPSPPPAPPSLTMQQRFDRDIQDAYYDYDKAIIRADARDNLTKSAEFLRSNPGVTITIEGHCDERGSTAYNLGLGDRRANAAKEFLVSIGISGDRIKTITYGKEKPFCTAHDESCWQQNRRAHLVCDSCGMR